MRIVMFSTLIISLSVIASQDETLKPVDQAVEDTGPLSTSLRDIQTDLRQPTGFDHVYRVPGEEDQLMRVSGSIYAVFPQSIYAPTLFGPVPIIPPGTVFYLDQSHFDSASEGKENSEMSNPDRIEPRVVGYELDDTKLDDEVNATRYSSDQQPNRRRTPFGGLRSSRPTIVNNKSYRAERLSELLTRAANADDKTISDLAITQGASSSPSE